MSKIIQLGRVTCFSLKHPDAARSLINSLIKTPNDSIILPYIDYPGPITKAILSKDFRSLTVCEPDADLRTSFQTHVQRTCPTKNIRIEPDDLLELCFKTHSDDAQKRCAELSSNCYNPLGGTRTYNCDDNVKLLLPLLKSKTEAAFLRNLYYQVSLRLGLCSDSFVDYYFLMSDRQRAYMIARPGQSMRLYRSTTVLYNTIFDMETLESYDLKTCFGINLRRIQNTAVNNDTSYKKVHLVSLKPRLDIIDKLKPGSLLEYRFLVTQMMHKRKGLVVDFLDKFFSDYLQDVAYIGINNSTTSGDLVWEQYHKLFLYLIQRKDYESSTFLRAVIDSEDIIASIR